MKPTRLLAIVAVAALLAIGVAIGALALRQVPQSGAVSGEAAIGGPFVLVNDHGETVTQASLAGKPFVIYFGYTFCPDVCPTTLADLTRWIHLLGPDAGKLNYVFVTVDPQRDTPKVLRAYLSSFDRRIQGFTGTMAQIARVAKEYRVYFQKAPTKGVGYLVDHSSLVYLMRADGSYAGVIPYEEKDALALAQLKKLAAGGA